MNCPRCQHANDAAATFCEECGARLGAHTCATCSAELKASAKFCTSCARLADRERRQAEKAAALQRAYDCYIRFGMTAQASRVAKEIG